jgi:hypothetical protein
MPGAGHHDHRGLHPGEWERAQRKGQEGIDMFRRAYLNQWPEVPMLDDTGGAFDAAVWSSLIGATPPRGHDVVFALDVAPDHSASTIAAAWSTPDGSWLQLADHRPGVDWVVGRWDELRRTWGGRLIVEKTGAAAFLLPRLLGADPVSRAHFVDSGSTFDAAVNARTVRHGNQAPLNDAVALGQWASTGEAGRRVLVRKDPRVSPLVAGVMALHGLTTAPVTGGWMVGV